MKLLFGLNHHLQSKIYFFKSLSSRSFLLLAAFTLISLSASAIRYRYFTAQSSSGAGTFCQTAGTTPISFTFTNTSTCGASGMTSNTAISVQWFTNNINSTSGGTAIGAPVVTNTGTTVFSMNASIATTGTIYYYCVVTYTNSVDVTPCNGGSTTYTTSATIAVTVSAAPTTSAAGSDQTTANCVTSATLAANTPVTGTGAWTCITNCGGVTITTPTSPTSTVTGLTAGVATTLRWTISNAGCTSSTDDVIITAGTCVSGNDACGGAVSVSCGNTYNGNTSTATSDAGLPVCTSTTPSAPGVWYVFTGDGSTVTANLCGSSYDTKLNVYSGASCGSLTTCVASNDDNGPACAGTNASVTFVTSVGTNYYILVNGYNNAVGNFSLAITCCTPTAPGCATGPTPADGSTLSSCTSTLSWTAPASAGCNGAASYDVYFGTSNPPPYVTNTTATSYSTTLAPATVYYWQIRPRNSSGASAGCAVWSFTSMTTTNPQYQLVDDATSASPYTCVTLTPAANTQRGCAWDANSTLNFAANFQYEWTVNLGSDPGGADGLAFVMQNDPQGRCECGTAGETMGAGGITNSVTVEIDTYLNSRDRDDGLAGVLCAGGPDPDHLDIWFNGDVNPSTDFNDCTLDAAERDVPTAIPLMNGGSSYDIENGLDHKLRISWNAATGTLTATILNNALTTTYGVISATFDPMTVFGTNTPFFGFTASTGGLNNQQSFCNPAVFLPVELSEVNLNCEDGKLHLNWTTNSENNNDFFIIERSRDGSNYEQVAIIDGAGNSNVPIDYSWTSEFKSEGIYYYQLSQVDFNGVPKILNTSSSNCAEISGMLINNVYETNGNLIIEFDAESKGLYEFEVTDYSGKRVAYLSKTMSQGQNTISLPDIDPSGGIYFLRINNSRESVVKRFGLF